MHLVLVGLMGAGKTTVGQLCAERLARPFVDTDELVEAATGSTVAEIFAAEGEAGFRARERVAVVDACAAPDPLVIACGGGAVLDAGNRAALKRAGRVVWLRASPAVLSERVGSDPARPLLTDGPVPTLARLAETRAAAYEDAADAAVDTEGLAPAEVADAVLVAFAS